MPRTKIDLPPERWDQLFAPSSCLAVISTIDSDGVVNAASFGTCTRVCHSPVYIAFTVGAHKDTALNVLATGEFTVNLPRHEREQLEKVCVVSLPFARGVNELERAGLTQMPGKIVKPPRVGEFARHFECQVEWTREWTGRLMVVGKVVAVSADADVVDENGMLIWDAAKSSHFCGRPHGGRFVAAYEPMAVGVPYDGPEAALFNT